MHRDRDSAMCFFKMKWPEASSVTAIDANEFDADE